VNNKKCVKHVLGMALIATSTITWGMEVPVESTEIASQVSAEQASDWLPSLSQQSINLLKRMKDAPLFQNLCKNGTGKEEECFRILRNFTNLYQPWTVGVDCNVLCQNELSHIDPFTCAQQRDVLIKVLKDYLVEHASQK
jgi:hypothetical protein